MHVIATAGHVDHGKSTLIRRLTGMEPDRLAEEQQRGLTIELGFAWTTLTSGEQVAFVDVPGHERFIRTMLAGVGPVPAVLFVVAADEGWMPQSAEHLAALDALNVQHGVLVVTRGDLADPNPVMADALARIRRTSLGDIPAVAVSAVSGFGLPRLESVLSDVVYALPKPDTHSDVRLWVDRSFTVAGNGTVVTGTLSAGTLRVGDELILARTGQRLRIRGLHTLNQRHETVAAVARVALNLRGIDRKAISRGDALLTPDCWLTTNVIDVELPNAVAGERILHIGSAAVSIRIRPLGADTARLTLNQALPLRVSDRLLLRNPGCRGIVGATVLDVRPPTLTRRGAAQARVVELKTCLPQEQYLRRVKFAKEETLKAMGLPALGLEVADWRVDPQHWAELARDVGPMLRDWQREHPFESGVPVEAARQLLALPNVELVHRLLSVTNLDVINGRVRLSQTELPESISTAAAILLQLDQPFTVSAARQALGTNRKSAMTLLATLDRLGVTERLPDDTRRILAASLIPQ